MRADMSSVPLQDRGIPPGKAVEAVAVGGAIVGTIGYVLYLASVQSTPCDYALPRARTSAVTAPLNREPCLCACWAVEEHFHVLEHTAKENVKEMSRHPGEAMLLMALFPLLSALGLALVIPLGPYVFTHAAFQDLHVIRPDHHCRLMIKVYRAWSAANGKLASKDL